MKASQPMKPDSGPERQRQRSTVKKTGKTIHGDSIEAKMYEAFAAGWNAFLATHSGLLMAHGIKDFRIGFEQAWAKYWQSRKE
jgi:hypothetical protein